MRRNANEKAKKGKTVKTGQDRGKELEVSKSIVNKLFPERGITSIGLVAFSKYIPPRKAIARAHFFRNVGYYKSPGRKTRNNITSLVLIYLTRNNNKKYPSFYL